MNTRARQWSILLLALALLLGLAPAACSSAPRASGEEDTGQAIAEITAIPSDVSCIRITVSGIRRATRLFDVTPMQGATLPLSGLPLGTDTFVGDAFPVACAAIGASVPTWVTNPVVANVTAATRFNVVLVFFPNGRGTVTTNFGDGGADAGGLPPNTVSCDASGCVCATGFGNCDGTLANGCEADLSSDPANCGACGAACSSGACVAGACSAPDGGSPEAGPQALFAPIVSPAAGVQNNDFLASLVTMNPGATICYTLDGSNPACTNGTCVGTAQTYNAASQVPINGTLTGMSGQVTLHALACMAGAVDSPIVAQTYGLQVASPTFQAPAPGAVPFGSMPVNPTAASATVGATGMYTTNGMPPTCASGTSTALPTNSITIAPSVGTEQIMMVGCKPGYMPSPVTAAVYSFVLNPPAFQPPGGVFDANQTVTLNDAANTGANDHICASTNGAVPGCGTGGTCVGIGVQLLTGNGAVVANVNRPTVVTAVACPGAGSQLAPSGATAASYVTQLDPIVFNPPTGTPIPPGGFNVTIYQNGSGHPYDFICWTSNGVAPSCACSAPGMTKSAGTSVTVPVTGAITLAAVACLNATSPDAYGASAATATY